MSEEASSWTISVIVPTYRRPKYLGRCLAALKAQTLPADEVLVCTRATDAETHAFLESFDSTEIPLTVLTVEEAGAIASYNAGLDQASGDLIAVTDDDTEPLSNWLELVAAHYHADAKIGAVGGRDRVHVGNRVIEPAHSTVGVFRWYGPLVGNHHTGVGPARDVDLLKGANMTFRRAALGKMRMDPLLRGEGAQYFLETALCLYVKRSGWRIIYDPNILVDHYPAPRFDLEQRDDKNMTVIEIQSYNIAYTLFAYASRRRAFMWALYSVLVGGRKGGCGVAALIYLTFSGKFDAASRMAAALRGMYAGWRTWRRSRVDLIADLRR